MQDYDKLGAFIQRRLNLASRPSEGEVDAVLAVLVEQLLQERGHLDDELIASILGGQTVVLESLDMTPAVSMMKQLHAAAQLQQQGQQAQRPSLSLLKALLDKPSPPNK